MSIWKSIKCALSNVKTTVVAFLIACSAIFSALASTLDNDPLTNPDWNNAITLLVIAIGLLFARDCDKSSNKLGVK